LIVTTLADDKLLNFVFGGMVLGVAEIFGSYFFGGGYRNVITAFLFIAILIFRTRGLSWTRR